MRWILRTLGTWCLGLAFILLVIDGTRMLAASGLVLTSLAESWRMVDAASFEAANVAVGNALGPLGLVGVWTGLMALPGWILFGVIGAVLVLVFRRRGHKRFVQRI